MLRGTVLAEQSVAADHNCLRVIIVGVGAGATQKWEWPVFCAVRGCIQYCWKAQKHVMMPVA